MKKIVNDAPAIVGQAAGDILDDPSRTAVVFPSLTELALAAPPVNNAPIANNDSYTARPGQTLAIAAPGFLANDSDPDGNSLTAVSVNITGLQGSLLPFTDGHFSFTPNAGFVGTTSFTYTMGDGFGGNATGTVSINVVNNAPIANDDNYSIRPGQTLSIAAPGLLANDSDPDGDPLSITLVNITGLQGSLLPFTDGHFSFTPNAGFVGTTSFTYTMGDGFGGNATGTVSIDVVNNAPIANNDNYSIRPGQTLSIAAPGLLANDSDPDGDPLSITLVNITGLQGSLLPFTDGHFSFTPNAGFVGTTSFTYTMGDGFGGNATGTVSINVVNNAPIANDDNYSIRPGQTLSIAAPGLLANDSDPDGDPLSITLVNITGLQGSLLPFTDGHFSFTPNAGFVGTTSFTYTMGDGFGGNATGTVSINVVNNAPIANDDNYSIRPGQTLSIAAPGLLANDSDPDGDPLSITLVNITGLQGSLLPFTDGHFSFTPNAGFTGSTSFAYTVSDGFGGFDTATVSINVAALPTETRSIGNAPERQSGPGGQWAAAWTNPAIVNSIVHKADVTSTAGWSAVQFSGLSPQTLAGGDIYSGDLGVSGQSVASSSTRQEIDGKEGLRFNLSQSATELTVYLSRLFTQDDGGAYVESGRIRLLDSAGNLVKESGFHAQNPGGTLTVTLHSDLAFSAVEINAGVYDTANTFIYGGYAQADGSFASGVLTDTLGGKHGSDFLVDKIDFQVPLSTVPLDVFIV